MGAILLNVAQALAIVKSEVDISNVSASDLDIFNDDLAALMCLVNVVSYIVGTL